MYEYIYIYICIYIYIYISYRRLRENEGVVLLVRDRCNFRN